MASVGTVVSMLVGLRKRYLEMKTDKAGFKHQANLLLQLLAQLSEMEKEKRLPSSEAFQRAFAGLEPFEQYVIKYQDKRTPMWKLFNGTEEEFKKLQHAMEEFMQTVEVENAGALVDLQHGFDSLTKTVSKLISNSSSRSGSSRCRGCSQMLSTEPGTKFCHHCRVAVPTKSHCPVSTEEVVRLVAGISSREPDVRKACAKQIAKWLASGESWRAQIASEFANARVISPLVKELLIVSPQVKHFIAVLQGVCYDNPQNQSDAIQEGAIEPLLYLLKNINSDVRRLAATALVTLVFCGARVDNMMKIRVLVGIFNEGSALCEEFAVETIADILRDHPRNAERFVVAGMMPLLADLLAKDGKSQTVKTDAASALRSITAQVCNDQTEATFAGQVEIRLQQLLDTGTEPQQEHAAAALLYLAIARVGPFSVSATDARVRSSSRGAEGWLHRLTWTSPNRRWEMHWVRLHGTTLEIWDCRREGVLQSVDCRRAWVGAHAREHCCHVFWYFRIIPRGEREPEAIVFSARTKADRDAWISILKRRTR